MIRKEKLCQTGGFCGGINRTFLGPCTAFNQSERKIFKSSFYAQYVTMKLFITLFFVVFPVIVGGKKFKEGEKPKWAKKDIRDYNDADLERLLDQWEVTFTH